MKKKLLVLLIALILFTGLSLALLVDKNPKQNSVSYSEFCEASENCFDKGILFDTNSILLPFFKEINKKFRNLELYNDSIFKKKKNY